jgi:diphthine-ammonia ligase
MLINSAPGERVFVSWSGGKDSYLALLGAKEKGLTVVSLLSFVGDDGLSRSHGLKTELLRKQAEALGIRLETEAVTWESYEAGFEKAVRRLKRDCDINGGVFGDINLDEHRQWLEKMSLRCGINYNLPLWQMEERAVSEELINRGGRAMLVAIRSDLVDEKWLGRFMDLEYLSYCEEIGISPCGEGGETHTAVLDGPLFQFPISYSIGKIHRLQKHALLEINLQS